MMDEHPLSKMAQSVARDLGTYGGRFNIQTAGHYGHSLKDGVEERHREMAEQALAVSANPEMANVNNDLWIRQETAEGRLYFYNRCTGVSQWHVPNDLYVPNVWQDDTSVKERLRQDFVTKMPGSARAVLEVDCVTQMRGKGVPDHVLKAQASLMNNMGREVVDRAPVRQPIPPRNVLQFTVVSATGLRDADFMPGRDKSDPYALVEIVGKEDSPSTFKTQVIMDDLDPVWNFQALMPDYEPGDILSLSVWDLDDMTEVQKAQDALCDVELMEDQLYKNLNSDDCLGRVLITPEDLAQAHGDEPFCFALEDEQNKDTDPYVYVKAKTLNGWPQFRGMLVPDVQDEIEFACPDLKVVTLEEPDPGSKVASVDSTQERGGFMGTFIGVFVEDARKLRRGDEIVCGRHRHTVKKIDSKGFINKKYPGRPIVYVHFEEDINGVIRDGDTWKKVTKTAEPGVFEDRVIIYFDYLTSKVANIPHVG